MRVLSRKFCHSFAVKRSTLSSRFGYHESQWYAFLWSRHMRPDRRFGQMCARSARKCRPGGSGLSCQFLSGSPVAKDVSQGPWCRLIRECLRAREPWAATAFFAPSKCSRNRWGRWSFMRPPGLYRRGPARGGRAAPAVAQGDPTGIGNGEWRRGDPTHAPRARMERAPLESAGCALPGLVCPLMTGCPGNNWRLVWALGVFAGQRIWT